MHLVEQHIIKSNNTYYKDLLSILNASKNLYNKALFTIRQHYFNKMNKSYTIDIASDNENAYLNYYVMNDLLKSSDEYKAMPLANSSQEVLKSLNEQFHSFFSLLQKKNKGEYNERINIPSYIKGDYYFAVFNKMFLSKPSLKNGFIKIPKTNFEFKSNHIETLTQVRLLPRNNYILIEVVYDSSDIEELPNNGNYLSIDLGVSNLASCSSNVMNSFIINGKPAKSINHYYNKERAKIQSELELKNKKKTSKKLNNLTLKRNNKIRDYFHKASKYIVNQAINHSINTIIIGKNNRWKQETNIGKENNQTFVCLPHSTLINQIIYKASLKGIKVILTEESYTSKASYYDMDEIPTYNKNNTEKYNFSGRRTKRGLYECSNGLTINADINGSLNILRKGLEKYAVNDVLNKEPVDKGLVLNPIKISF